MLSSSAARHILRKSTAVACLVLTSIVGHADSAGAQDSLRFFKNYFVTGDYVAAGVAIRGTGGSRSISVSGVPEGADIVAAFLYWQTVLKLQDGADAGTVGVMFDGYPLANASGVSIARAVNPSGTAPCWSSGGATGSSNGTHKSVTYRADVLRYLQAGTDGGKISVNRSFPVVFPDAGSTGNVTPSTSGATLVVIFRQPSMPLRSVVLIDGGFTLDNAHPEMQQTITGFYQAAGSAKMTHVVGDGQMNFSEQIFFQGEAVGGSNPFVGPSWDTLTVENLPLSTDAASATVRVAPVSSAFDCISWSALVFSTAVPDSDEDGLLDVWESSSAPLVDPNAGCVITPSSPAACFLPNLKAMGADPNIQDIFIELGAMTTAAYANAVQSVGAHSHFPSRQTLESVAAVFNAAPPNRPRRSGTGSISGPIRLHFDVGNASYVDPATGNLVPYQTGLPTANQCRNNWQPACAIIRLDAGAQGGEAIAETVGCAVDANSHVTCGGLFSNYPGTVGWKSGFLLLRNQPLYKVVNGQAVPFALGPQLPSLEAQCVAVGVNCVRRFDRNRKDVFRYALFAHALGLVRQLNGEDVLDSTGARQPKNTSGIADGGGVGGGDLMVTLGLWDNHTGSEFIQRSTLMHELGHTLGLRHGGGAPAIVNGVPVAQPNCKPNYLSIMNYLFQVRGLVPPAGGPPVIDLSRQVLGNVNEGSLVENMAGLPGWTQPMSYRTSWYVPSANQELSQVIGPVLRRCDGSQWTSGALMVRVDGTTTNGSIDWNWDGSAAGTGIAQDINFNSFLNDGSVGGGPVLAGYNDFASADLRQVASRRNGGSGRIDGGLSLDVGFGDVGFGDVGFGDVGFGDVGFGDVGFGDVGFGDVGFGDVGFGDVGFGDVGFGDVGFGDVGAPPGELDLDTGAGLNGPNALTATVLNNRIRLDWRAPHIGSVESYNLYKVVGASITATSPVLLVGNNPTTTFDVTTAEDRDVKTKVTYTYFVVARLRDGSLTAPSNFVTVTK